VKPRKARTSIVPQVSTTNHYIKREEIVSKADFIRKARSGGRTGRRRIGMSYLGMRMRRERMTPLSTRRARPRPLVGWALDEGRLTMVAENGR
jgi:hypothetical protein